MFKKIDKQEIKTIFKLYLINMSLFLAITFFSGLIIKDFPTITFNSHLTPNFLEILLNNSKFIVIYSVFYLGAIYYYVSFSYSAILFYLYFQQQGFYVFAYKHVFIEILAFTIPVAISLRLIKKNYFFYFSVSFLTILISAALEASNF